MRRSEIIKNNREITLFIFAGQSNMMAESKGELKSLLMKVNEESEKSGLKHNIKKLRAWYLVP